MTNSKQKFLIATLMIIGFWCYVVSGTPNTQIGFEGCSKTTYAAGDPYGKAVVSILSDVTKKTPSSPKHSYKVVSHDPNSPSVAFGVCGSSLSDEDCSSCMIVASNEVQTLCSGHISGIVLLGDCTIGYAKKTKKA
ncbi:OLC1v1007940C1 [Oldenlandia corymbosa var. corymbosa]|uniref:OLC1v1007940C1 n=1 Tax=Oldenlandia corymbosa var. corymbosa TaxID=529605 RepID=A0AAV1DKE2_OLDCO|nr:OLC1v1007940C1 [Oldenlandia corymbosa var. corymbosa]